MRIGIFSECYEPVMNGIVVSINTFKEEMEKRGHEFFIFTTECPGYIETNDHIFRFSSILPFKSKGGKYPIAAPQDLNILAKKVMELELDVIHSQHLLNTGALGLKIAKKLHIPAVLTYHTLLTEYMHYVPIIGGLAKYWIIRKSRKYCNQYDAIVTPSPSMAKLLVSYGVKTPITSIPTGIEIEKWNNGYSKAEIYEKWKIPNEHNQLLIYVSRIGKEKNVLFLLETMEKLIKEYQDIHLLMVGPGPEIENCKEWIKVHKIENYVTFTDRMERAETEKTTGAGDIFVFPSISETQGIVIMEAMAAGVPVIAINKMGPSDYVVNGETGFLTDLNLDQFIDKIKYLLDHGEERKKMALRSSQEAKKYSSQKCAQEMINLYEKTINSYSSK